jgi:tellurite resistance protein
VARGPKCLVIDADIARSAGGMDAQDGRSKCCRDFLNEVRDTKHKVVTTEAIREEWHKHQSRFARTWLVSMMAHKRVCWVDAPADDELRHKVELVTLNEKKRVAILKDIHLAEAAIKADKIVMSMDETVRNCFHETAQTIGVLKQIVWVNPSRNEEKPLEWLQDGAELEKKRLLGYSEEG